MGGRRLRIILYFIVLLFILAVICGQLLRFPGYEAVVGFCALMYASKTTGRGGLLVRTPHTQSRGFESSNPRATA